MKKIRVTHVMYSFGLGGLEGMLATMIDRMNADAFSHSLCVFNEDLASLAKISRAKDVDVHVIKRRFSHDPTTVLRLAGVLKKAAPDIVRTYNWSGMEGIIAAKMIGAGIIIHSEHGFNMSEIYRKKIRRVLARRLLLGYCEKVIAVSEVLKNWLRDDVRVDKDKIVCIPNGCDLKRFFPGRDAVKRSELGVMEGQVLIGSVGALKKLKGYDVLLKGFVELAKIHDNIKLIIVGDGPEKKNLCAMAEDMGMAKKVIFPGTAREVAPFYRAMDIFVLPSLSENLPNTLLEAMASGLPVVASDVGDVRKMLGEGASGIIVEPSSVGQISAGIQRYLEVAGLAKEKGAAARNRAERYFNIEDVVRTYESLYLNAVSEKGTAR